MGLTFVFRLLEEADHWVEDPGCLKSFLGRDEAVLDHGLEAVREPHETGIVPRDSHRFDFESERRRIIRMPMCISESVPDEQA